MNSKCFVILVIVSLPQFEGSGNDGQQEGSSDASAYWGSAGGAGSSGRGEAYHPVEITGTLTCVHGKGGIVNEMDDGGAGNKLQTKDDTILMPKGSIESIANDLGAYINIENLQKYLSPIIATYSDQHALVTLAQFTLRGTSSPKVTVKDEHVFLEVTGDYEICANILRVQLLADGTDLFNSVCCRLQNGYTLVFSMSFGQRPQDDEEPQSGSFGDRFEIALAKPDSLIENYINDNDAAANLRDTLGCKLWEAFDKVTCDGLRTILASKKTKRKHLVEVPTRISVKVLNEAGDAVDPTPTQMPDPGMRKRRGRGQSGRRHSSTDGKKGQ